MPPFAGIGRAIGVTEIFFCKREPGVENLAHFWWITVVTGNLIGRKSYVRRAFLFCAGMRRA